MASCTLSGTKIYEGEGLRVLACTEGHAKAVSAALSRPPAGMGVKLYHSLRSNALRAFNERTATLTPTTKETDYDIPFEI